MGKGDAGANATFAAQLRSVPFHLNVGDAFGIEPCGKRCGKAALQTRLGASEERCHLRVGGLRESSYNEAAKGGLGFPSDVCHAEVSIRGDLNMSDNQPVEGVDVTKAWKATQDQKGALNGLGVVDPEVAT